MTDVQGGVRREVQISWDTATNLSSTQLVDLLRTFGDLIPNPLSQRVELTAYAAKLQDRADIGIVTINGAIVGLMALYANDLQSRHAHLPLLSLLPGAQGQGIGHVMVSRALALARRRGMRTIDLNVQATNRRAQWLYQSIGFTFARVEGDSWSMQYDFDDLGLAQNPSGTPLEPHNRVAALLGLDVDLRIKRDDLLQMFGGGTAARKVIYIIRRAVDDGHDAIVTTGGPQSNHARATAIAASTIGLRCHLVITPANDIAPQNLGNFQLMQMSGATIELAKKSDLAERMDQAMERLRSAGHLPLYVWGGGHGVPGTKAFVDASVEAQTQSGSWCPDVLIAASGTGSTQAGFAVGYLTTHTRVIGISVARGADRGGAIVEACIDDYMTATGDLRPRPNVEFRDEWTDGGYEKASSELWDIIRRAARGGVNTDPTYSGKALRGLVEMVRSGEIPRRARVLFWHTGGLLNLQAVTMPKHPNQR